MALPEIPKYKPLDNTSGSSKKIIKTVLIGVLAILLGAFGLEASGTDFDLGQLLRGNSLQESKVERDDQGNVIYDKEGNVVTDATKGKKASDYNCDDFTAQPEAQKFFLRTDSDNDLYRLDGDNDGKACEDLPQGN